MAASEGDVGNLQWHGCMVDEAGCGRGGGREPNGSRDMPPHMQQRSPSPSLPHHRWLHFLTANKTSWLVTPTASTEGHVLRRTRRPQSAKLVDDLCDDVGNAGGWRGARLGSKSLGSKSLGNKSLGKAWVTPVCALDRDRGMLYPRQPRAGGRASRLLD